MYFWVFQGNLGQGKTAAMSILMHYYRAQMRKQGVDCRLFSNYGLTDSLPLTDHNSFEEVARSECSILGVDEGHTSFDSRMFGSKQGIYFTQFAFYYRKLRTCMMVTSPGIENLDSRIRSLTNILVHCEKHPHGFKYYIFDYQAMRLLTTKFLPMPTASKIFRAGLYNTHEIIRAITFPTKEQEFDEFLMRIKGISDDYMADRKDAAARMPPLLTI